MESQKTVAIADLQRLENPVNRVNLGGLVKIGALGRRVNLSGVAKIGSRGGGGKIVNLGQLGTIGALGKVGGEGNLGPRPPARVDLVELGGWVTMRWPVNVVDVAKRGKGGKMGKVADIRTLLVSGPASPDPRPPLGRGGGGTSVGPPAPLGSSLHDPSTHTHQGVENISPLAHAKVSTPHQPRSREN